MLLPKLKFNLVIILAWVVRGEPGCYTEGKFLTWRWEKSGPRASAVWVTEGLGPDAQGSRPENQSLKS